MKETIKNSPDPNETKNKIYRKIGKIFILILRIFFIKLS